MGGREIFSGPGVMADGVIDTRGARIFARREGSGPPLLLLHGFPQTHLMWREVVPLLARDFTVVSADLRGYGQSSCPPSAADHAPYSKRSLAGDMVELMDALGHERFGVAGYDRGGRVAYRMALDHPEHVERLAVLDVLPIEATWERADDRLALAFWPWSLLAQPEPLPERLVAGAPGAVIDDALGGGWGTPADVFGDGARARPTSPSCANPIACTPSARSTGRRRRSTASTIAPTGSRAAGSRLRCWRSGAGRGLCRPGTPTRAGHSPSGASSPTTWPDGRSTAGTSSRRSVRPRPRRSWGDSSSRRRPVDLKPA